MKGIAGKRQPIGNTDRTSRLRSCSKQGVMGAGSVCSEMPSPALRLDSGVCPHFPFL